MKKWMLKLEDLLAVGGLRKDSILLVISGVAVLCSLLHVPPLPFDPAWIAIVLCGIPILLEALIGLVTRFDIKADVLVSMALLASIGIGEIFAAGEVAFIMQLGGLLEQLTVARARAGIEKLVHLTPQTARLITDGSEKIIPAEEVRVNDRLLVKPGETVPVDGVILSGQTSVNEAVMTGESMPVDKSAGDEVSSGTVNQFGAFTMQAVRVGEDSSIQRMIRLVQSADAGKAKIVSLADRWATWIVVIALAAAALTWLISGQVIRSVTILVVFCPCSLVLATPTAIMAAIGNATRHGFLVKEGDALERLADVNCITFDKTGTLTYGTPKVTAVEPAPESGLSAEEVYGLCAAAEQLSEHPLGKAVVSCYTQQFGAQMRACEGFQLIPGRGVSADVGEKAVLAGNGRMMQENGILLSEEVLAQSRRYLQEGCTVIYVAAEHRLAGFLALSDTIREESPAMVDALNGLFVESVLLTGDNGNAARTIAGKVHIREVYANCRPEDKLAAIDSLQKNGRTICMVGDGINDAPALKMADVGIAMGGVGSDIAVDAADICLVDDQVGELPHLIALSKRMMFIIRCNLTFSMTLNFIAIILAITGILNPVIGALVHNAGSVLVILNSFRVLRFEEKPENSR